jgi:hypothetical protein
VEKCLKDGQEQHVRGGVPSAGEGAQRRGQARRVENGPAAAPEALARRPRPVAGEVQEGRRSGELAAPEIELLFEGRAGEPAALPHREVGVLYGQLRQRGGRPRGQGGVERRQLVVEDVRGPVVDGDMVRRDQQQVLLGAHAEQQRVEDRAILEVERPPALGGAQPAGFAPARRLRQGAQIGDRQGEALARRMDDLDRLSHFLGIGRPQHLVAPPDLVQGRLQKARVEPAGQVDGELPVVGGAPGLEAVQKPEPLLREGEREPVLPGRSAAGEAGDARSLRGPAFLLFQPPGEQRELLRGQGGELLLHVRRHGRPESRSRRCRSEPGQEPLVRLDAETGDEPRRRAPGGLRDPLVFGRVGEQGGERGLPGGQVLLRHDRDLDPSLVDPGLVALDRPHRHDPAHPQSRLRQPSLIARHHRNAAQQGLDYDLAESLSPEGGDHQDADAGEELVHVVHRREQGHVGQRGEQSAVGGGGAPGGDGGERYVGHPPRKVNEDRAPLDRRGVDHRHPAAIETGESREGAGAIGGGVDHRGVEPGPAADVVLHGAADREDSGRPPQQVGLRLARLERGRAERQGRRAVRQVDPPGGARLQNLVEHRTAGVFRDDRPVGLEFVDLADGLGAELAPAHGGVDFDPAPGEGDRSFRVRGDRDPLVGQAGQELLAGLAAQLRARRDHPAGVAARRQPLQEEAVRLVGAAVGEEVGERLDQQDLHPGTRDGPRRQALQVLLEGPGPQARDEFVRRPP